MSGTLDNLCDFESWEYQRLVAFEKEGELDIRMVIESNCHSGDFIKVFQIGDKIGDTGVKDIYSRKTLRLFEQNSLLGEREFKNGSITYEFLLEPLGIELPIGCL